MASGRPVVAYGEGGALETVKENVSGVFFRKPSPEFLMEAVARAEKMPWDAGKIRAQALNFSRENFISKLEGFFDNILTQ